MVQKISGNILTISFLLLLHSCGNQNNTKGNGRTDQSDFQQLNALEQSIASIRSRIIQVEEIIMILQNDLNGTVDVPLKNETAVEKAEKVRERDKDAVRISGDEHYEDSVETVLAEERTASKKSILVNARNSLTDLEERLRKAGQEIKQIKTRLEQDAETSSSESISAQRKLINTTEESISQLENDLSSSRDQLALLQSD